MSIYVNINNSYDNVNGTGDILSPFTYAQFSADAKSSSSPSRTYFLKGKRESSAKVGGFDLIAGANHEILDIKGSAGSTIKITTWPEEIDPWRIKYNSRSDNTFFEFRTFGVGLEVSNGMIHTTSGGLSFNDATNSNTNTNISNLYLRSNHGIYLRNKDFYNIYGSTLISDDVGISGCLIGNNFDTVVLKNNIFSLDGFAFGNGSVFSLDYGAWTSGTYGFGTAHSVFVSNVTNFQQDFTKPSIFSTDIFNITKEDLDYLSDDFKTISIRGDSSVPKKESSFGVDRDGVGFLYFDQGVVSGGPDVFSGEVPLDVTLQYRVTTSAGTGSIDWGDGTTDNFPRVAENEVVSNNHTYTEVNTFFPELIVNSFNNWNVLNDLSSSEDRAITISADGETSATFFILDNETSATTTSAYTFTDFIVSADVVPFGSSLFEYTYYWGDGTSTSESSESPIDFPIVRKQYKEVGTYDILLVSNGVNSATDVISVSANPVTTFYVDVSVEYVSVGDGSDSNPFNYNQFVSKISYNGDARRHDIFKVRGFKRITRDGNTSPYNAISTDKDKYLVIDSWNPNSNGPWVFDVVGDSADASNNVMLDFEGSTIKNGVIYNEPSKNSSFEDVGFSLTITNAKTMYILNQGIDGKIVLAPTDNESLSGVNIIGCTIRNDGEYSEKTSAVNDEEYVFNLHDSVVIGFSADSVFLSADFDARNNVFSNIDEHVSASFIDPNFVENQFEYSNYPTGSDYPFSVNNIFYNEDMDIIKENKSLLAPFSGINYPPNPGTGANEYSGYDVGLFGTNRNSVEGNET